MWSLFPLLDHVRSRGGLLWYDGRCMNGVLSVLLHCESIISLRASLCPTTYSNDIPFYVKSHLQTKIHGDRLLYKPCFRMQRDPIYSLQRQIFFKPQCRICISQRCSLQTLFEPSPLPSHLQGDPRGKPYLLRYRSSMVSNTQKCWNLLLSSVPKEPLYHRTLRKCDRSMV